MANRAYLYAAERDDVWERPGQLKYYDSRHAIPLAWLFLFSAADVQLVDVCHGGSQWQEIRLVSDRSTALARFVARQHLLLQLVRAPIGNHDLGRFLATLQGRCGRFLLLDPSEVIDGDDAVEAVGLEQALSLLDLPGRARGEVLEALRPYIGDLITDDAMRYDGQVFGYTYWED